jgi:hypothetical protein
MYNTIQFMLPFLLPVAVYALIIILDSKLFFDRQMPLRAVYPEVALPKLADIPTVRHDDLCTGSVPLQPQTEALIVFSLYLPINAELNTEFKQRYVKPAVRTCRYFNTKFPQWQVRVYLSQNLKQLAHVFAKHNVNVCVMHTNSQGHLGMLWRYMASADPNVTVPILIVDADDYEALANLPHPWESKWGVWKRAFCKFLKDDSKKFFVRPNGVGNAIRLPPLSGANWGCRPGALKDILQIYLQYAGQSVTCFGIDEHMLRHRIAPLMTKQNTLTTPYSDDKTFFSVLAQFYAVGCIVYFAVLISKSSSNFVKTKLN